MWSTSYRGRARPCGATWLQSPLMLLIAANAYAFLDFLLEARSHAPVSGSSEQGSSSVPRTLRAGAAVDALLAALLLVWGMAGVGLLGGECLLGSYVRADPGECDDITCRGSGGHVSARGGRRCGAGSRHEPGRRHFRQALMQSRGGQWRTRAQCSATGAAPSH